MTGGFIQLVARGVQDSHLTGNPQMTFFKTVHHKHTNFSMESIKQAFDGNITTDESMVSSNISRNGDLLSNLWLDVLMDTTGASDGSTHTTPINTDWTINTGHAFVKKCDIKIGGQLIDEHDDKWLDIWNSLTDKNNDEYIGLNKNQKSYLETSGSIRDNTSSKHKNIQLYIPLKFWFCRNIGLSLPLVALQYHHVEIDFTFRNINTLINSDITSTLTGSATSITESPVVNLWGDYIFLDTDERRRFAQMSHEYLIEQVQMIEYKGEGGLTNIDLKLNHPVKELIWVNQDLNVTVETEFPNININSVENKTDIHNVVTLNNNNDYFCYMTADNNMTNYSSEYIHGQFSNESFSNMTIKLNGSDRFHKRKASYFRLCQPLQAGHKVPEKHIYCYSFALKPEDHQPSGTCNFSRIDNALMVFDQLAQGNLTVYAINYNILRIMSGMGGLEYSN